MLNWKGRLVLLLATVISPMAQAGSLDASINNDNVRIGFNWDNPNAGPRNLERAVDFYYTTNNSFAANVGLMVIGETGNRANPLEFAMGAKAMLVSTPSGSTTGLALGFDARYYPVNINRLGFVTDIYYSPDVIAFGPATSIVNAQFRIEYQIMAYAFAHISYRNFYVSYPGGPDYVVNNQLMFGFRLLFD